MKLMCESTSESNCIYLTKSSFAKKSFFILLHTSIFHLEDVFIHHVEKQLSLTKVLYSERRRGWEPWEKSPGWSSSWSLLRRCRECAKRHQEYCKEFQIPNCYDLLLDASDMFLGHSYIVWTPSLLPQRYRWRKSVRLYDIFEVLTQNQNGDAQDAWCDWSGSEDQRKFT